jgi:hypothetical protein
MWLLKQVKFGSFTQDLISQTSSRFNRSLEEFMFTPRQRYIEFLHYDVKNGTVTMHEVRNSPAEVMYVHIPQRALNLSFDPKLFMPNKTAVTQLADYYITKVNFQFTKPTISSKGVIANLDPVFE